MSEKIVFGNTVLKGVNKAGLLKPDNDGYYSVVLGALGIENSAGEIYVDTETARQTFESNPTLMRRLRQGLLRAEWGHPDPSEYPNFMAFERRVRRIDESRICGHFKEIWLEQITYNGQQVLGILGKIRPSGPHGNSLKEMLENPNENVTFSGRYYSNVGKTSTGQRYREIHTVGTWDFVSEPGIEQAQKWLSPSLESRDDAVLLPEWINMAVKEEKTLEESGMSLESGGYSAQELMIDLNLSKTPPKSSIKRFHW